MTMREIWLLKVIVFDSGKQTNKNPELPLFLWQKA